MLFSLFGDITLICHKKLSSNGLLPECWRHPGDDDYAGWMLVAGDGSLGHVDYSGVYIPDAYRPVGGAHK